VTRISTATAIPKRRIAVAALVAALLSAAAFTATSPTTASASPGDAHCDRGDFCMWYNYNFVGGIFQYAGSASDLRRNFFEGNPTQQVSRNTASVQNAGKSATRAYVLAYDRPFWKSSTQNPKNGKLCIRQGTVTNLPSNWVDNIMSYRWVTPGECVTSATMVL